LSQLKEKSGFNITSAEYLIDESLHASSVHCSYYAFFQRMKYTMMKRLSLDPDQYYQRYRQSKSNSHVFLINLVCSEYKISGKTDRDKEILYRQITDIKELREMADYDDISISDGQSDKALRLCNSLILELKKTFKI